MKFFARTLLTSALSMTIFGFSQHTNAADISMPQTGAILTGEATINSTVWVKDMTKIIELLFEDSDSRKQIISGMEGVDKQGRLFETNSLLDLVDYTYSSMKLSPIGSEILYGATVGSIGFPTAPNYLAMTLIGSTWDAKWQLNETKLKEYFPSVRFACTLQLLNLIQRDGQLPNQVLVSQPGTCMFQFHLCPLK